MSQASKESIDTRQPLEDIFRAGTGVLSKPRQFGNVGRMFRRVRRDVTFVTFDPGVKGLAVTNISHAQRGAGR